MIEKYEYYFDFLIYYPLSIEIVNFWSNTKTVIYQI